MTLELDRERAVQALCAHYAHDHLSTGELEARFERAYAAADGSTLRTVLDGLPALPRGSVPVLQYEPPEAAAVLALPPREREKRYVSVFSEVKKTGVWRVPEFVRVRAYLGSVTLDLREADIPANGVEFDVETFLGEVKILLPLGIGADVECFSVLGEVNDKTRPGTPGLPFVRVRGGASLASITVQTKLPKSEKLEGWRATLRAMFTSDDA